MVQLNSNTETQSWETLLDSILDAELNEVPMAQAFSEEYGQLAITVQTHKGRKVLLVTSDRQIHEVSDKERRIPGKDLMLREHPTEYADLVVPRWRKESLQAFLQGIGEPNPRDVYGRLREALANLMDFTHSPIAADIISCWVIATYFYRSFDAFPYLGVMGPKGSGKTKLAQIIEEVAFNPIRTASITQAQLFRSVEVTGGTLILDEQEELGGKYASGDRMSILRDGYKRGGKVLRTKETTKGYSTEQFDTYGPKVIINTSGMEELLADRCIPVHMLRSTGEQGKALVSQWREQLHSIRDDLFCLALSLFQQVAKAYLDPSLSPALNARQRERWLPILALAGLFCPQRVPHLEAEASKDKNSAMLSDPVDLAFLQALDKLVTETTSELTAGALGVHMAQLLEWSDVGSAKVGRLIRKYFGEVGRRSGSTGSNRYTITRERVDDILARYPIPEVTEGTEG